MKPPSKKTRRSISAPPVLAMITVLQTPAINRNSPAAICWIRNTSSICLKNLRKEIHTRILEFAHRSEKFRGSAKEVRAACLLASGANPME